MLTDVLPFVHHGCSISFLKNALFSTLLYGLYGNVNVTVRDSGPRCAYCMVPLSGIGLKEKESSVTCLLHVKVKNLAQFIYRGECFSTGSKFGNPK